MVTDFEMSTVTVEGRIAGVKELQTSGNKLYEIRIAQNYQVKTTAGYEKKTNWYDAKYWTREGKDIPAFLKASLVKGNKITVAGELQQREFTHNGVDRKSLEVVNLSRLVVHGVKTAEDASPEEIAAVSAPIAAQVPASVPGARRPAVRGPRTSPPAVSASPVSSDFGEIVGEQF